MSKVGFLFLPKVKSLTVFPLRCRCTSHKDDLETPGVPRSKEHTDIIREKLGLGDLWSLYGVVGDVEVRCRFSLCSSTTPTNLPSYSQIIFLARASTSCSPQIFCINSSRGRLKITSWSGSQCIYVNNAPVHQAREFRMISIGGRARCYSQSIQGEGSKADAFLLGLRPHRHLLVCEGFPKVEDSSNGLEMIRRL